VLMIETVNSQLSKTYAQDSKVVSTSSFATSSIIDTNQETLV
jgi:hypothetical protein